MTTQLLRRVERITNKNKKVIARKAKKYIKDTQKRIQEINRKYVRKMVTSSMAIKMIAYVTILVAISASYQPSITDAQAWSSHLQFDKTKAVPVSVEQKKVNIKVTPIVPAVTAVPVAEAAAKKTTKKATSSVRRSTTTRERATSAAPVSSAPVGEIQTYAERRSNEMFGEGHFPALKTLWNRESGWNSAATNKSSGACGIPQANPCSKAGGDYRTNAYTQVEWGLKYISGRYGNPTKALSFWNSRHWY